MSALVITFIVAAIVLVIVAIALVAVDSGMSDAVLEEVRNLTHVRQAKKLTF